MHEEPVLIAQVPAWLGLGFVRGKQVALARNSLAQAVACVTQALHGLLDARSYAWLELANAKVPLLTSLGCVHSSPLPRPSQLCHVSCTDPAAGGTAAGGGAAARGGGRRGGSGAGLGGGRAAPARPACVAPAAAGGWRRGRRPGLHTPAPPPTLQGLHCAWLALWAASHLPAGAASGGSGMAAGVAALAAGPTGAAAVAGVAPQLAAVAAAAANAWAGGTVACPNLLFLA